MTRLLLAAMLLLALPQDAVDELLRDLQGEDVTEREAAEEKLIERGEAIVKHLEALGRSDVSEIRDRATRIVTTIRRQHLSGRPVRVTLDLTDCGFRDALKAVESKSGFELFVEADVEDRRISLRADNILWLDAVARLCAAHGDARFEEGHYGDPFWTWCAQKPGVRARFLLAKGPFGRGPAALAGAVRLSLESIRMETRHEQTRFDLRCLWQPNAHPFACDGIRLASVFGENGHEYVSTREDDTSSPWSSRIQALHFDRIDRNLRGRGRIDVAGRCRLWFGTYASEKFDKPAESVGARRQVGEFTATLTEFDTKTGEIKVALKAQKTYAWGSPWNVTCLTLETGDGAQVSPAAIAGGDLNVRPERMPRIAAVRLSTYSDIFFIDIPFSFQGVKLPEW